jgi:hypothetical protein
MMIPYMVDEQTWFDSLIVDFPKQNMPSFSGMDWRICGDSIVELPFFKKNHAPGTQDFSDWKSWAEAFYNTVSDVEESQ